MTSESSKTNVIKPPKPIKGITKPQSISTLNVNEAYDKFGGARIDGLKIVNIETSTVTANGHIVAYYK